MYSIFSPQIGLNKWLTKNNAEILSPEGNALSGIGSGSGLVGGGVSNTDPNAIGSGEAASILAYAKLSFTDTTEGWMQGLDTDNKYKWIIGDGTSSIDWGVTTASTLTVVGSITAISGTIGGFTINANSITDVAGTFGMDSTVTAGDDIRFWAGHATPASAPFYVTESGVLVATSMSVGNFPSLPDDSNLVGYWSLDEGSGTTRADYSASGNAMTLVDTPTVVTSVSGYGLDFNGTSEYCTMDGLAAAFDDYTALSICFWVNKDTDTTQALYSCSTDNSNYFVIYGASDARVSFSIVVGASTYLGGETPIDSSPVTQNNFIVYTADSTGNKLYINGVEQVVTYGTGTAATDGTLAAASLTINKMSIAVLRRAGISNYLNGKMDEIRTFNKKLTLNEVKALYLNPSGLQQQGVASDKGLIGGWTINSTTIANSTNIILDAANKAISINDATFGNSGIQLQYNAGTPRLYVGDGANKYFQFDGTDASVGSDSLINTTPAGTIESRANSLFEDKAFIGNYNDGIPETTGGGSTITRDLVTTTLVGSFGAAGLLSAEFGLVYFADSFEIIMQAKEVATVEAGRFGVSSEGTRHAYFWFDGGALKASSTDDDGNTATTITGITTTNWNTYRIVFDAGTSIKFYVNDILKATHDYTSAFDRWLKFYFMASEAAGDSTLYITNNYTIFADI